MVVHLDDVIMSGKSKNDIELLLKSPRNGMSMDANAKDKHLQSFVFTDDGNITSFMRIEIDTTFERKHLKQPHLMQRMLSAFGLNDNIEDAAVNFGRNDRKTPAVKPLLV